MKSKRTLVLTAVLGIALTSWVAATITGDGQHVMPPLPKDATEAQIELIEAYPFTVQEPLTHWWRMEQPTYNTGTLLVLAVDKDAVHPRQTFEPVLYCGDETVERINVGHESGFVVAIVPSSVDLTTAPIFFGTAALPEELDAAACRAELAKARSLGVMPTSAEQVQSSLKDAVSFEDSYDLHYFASTLIEQYSPMETDLISGLRAPRVGE